MQKQGKSRKGLIIGIVAAILFAGILVPVIVIILIIVIVKRKKRAQ